MGQDSKITAWLETELGDQIALHGRFSLGRDDTNNIILPTPQVSRRHAVIESREDGYRVVDLGGVNGVYVNGNRVGQPQLLHSGDRLELADKMFTFRLGEQLSAKPVSDLPARLAQGLPKASPPLPNTTETVAIPLPSQRVKLKDEPKLTPAPPSGASAPAASSPLKSPSPPPPAKPSPKPWIVRLGIAGLILGLGFYLLAGPMARMMPTARGTHALGAAKPSSSPTAAVARLADIHTWTNSLGMKFVPAGTPNVLFSVWDVRVKDYRAFVDATHPDSGDGIYVTKVNIDENGVCSIVFERDPSASWKNPCFDHPQTVNDPVVGVSWNDAQAFCEWLTQKERAEKKIGPDLEYRLPTDAEWTAAAGNGKYPWGDEWPQPARAGNYCDQAFAVGLPGAGWNTFVLPDNDGYAQTSPVGSFRANDYGLHDMGGNVWQWCQDWYQTSMNSDEIRHTLPAMGDDEDGHAFKVLRGGSWAEKTPEHLLSACRSYDDPATGFADRGFRVVVARAP